MSPFPSPIYGETISLSPTASEEDDPLDDDLDVTVDEASGTIHKVKKSRKLEGEIEKHTLIIDPKLPLYWAAISGTIGAQSMLLAKCVAEMISSTLSGDNQFRFFGTYVIIGAMVATLLTQTHTLNLATMSGDTMSAYPVFQAFWISMSNISGIVFFQQSSEFTSTQWMLFPSAILLVVLGMTLIAKHEKFGNRVKYSVAMPISLSSPRQHDIVAQSFVFRVSTPQRLQEDDDNDYDHQSTTPTPRRRHASVDVV
jgi:multidrug transporter EmrE-like cation transporter